MIYKVLMKTYKNQSVYKQEIMDGPKFLIYTNLKVATLIKEDKTIKGLL